MAMLLFLLHRLWSIIDDAGSVVSSVVSSHPALLSFHMLAGNLDRALLLKPTVSLDIISLVASSCGHYRGHIEQRHWFSLMGTVLPFEITPYAI
jgi:hypothetical protein